MKPGTAHIQGPYRYDLTRTIDTIPLSHRRLLAVMVNPSTATAETNDHTITKLMAFAELWGFGDLIVVNLFAYRARHVIDLKVTAEVGKIDIVGPKNDFAIKAHASGADEILVAWGAKNKIPTGYRSRIPIVMGILEQTKKPIFCLGRTKCGQPCHPLTLAYATKREKFE